MSKNIKEQYDVYKVADGKVQDSREALDLAMKERSGVVEQFVIAFGKGPFEIDGKTIQAIRRSLKDDNDKVIGYTWFFKTIGKKATVIE